MEKNYIICILFVLIISFLIYKYYQLKERTKVILNKLKNAEYINNDLRRSYDILEWNHQINNSIIDEAKKYKPNKQLKILIADYYIDSALITKQVLVNLGIQSEFVKNGQDLITKVKEDDYDVIITNNVLEGSLDGVETFFYLKKMLDFNTPVIILTTSRNSKYFLNECGFDDYIEKILTEEKAIKSLTKVIENLKFKKVNK